MGTRVPARHVCAGRDLARSAGMPPSCPHGGQPDVPVLRVVFIGEIVRADAALLVTVADLLHTSGLLPLAAAEPAAPRRRLQQGPRHGLQLVGAHDLPAREACTHSAKRSWEALR